MDIEEASIEFIEKHIEGSFKGIMNDYIIENLYWIDEEPNKARAVAEMEYYDPHHHATHNNLSCLFPPFEFEEGSPN